MMNTMCFSCYSVAAMFILMWRKISQLSNWLPSTLMNLTKKMHILLLLCSTNVMLIWQIITQPRMAYQSAVVEVRLFYFYWTTFLKSLFFCCFNYIEVEFNLYYVVIVLCLHWKKKNWHGAYRTSWLEIVLGWSAQCMVHAYRGTPENGILDKRQNISLISPLLKWYRVIYFHLLHHICIKVKYLFFCTNNWLTGVTAFSSHCFGYGVKLWAI